MPFDELDQRCRGRWKSILSQLGVPQQLLSGRNCPCPSCGGTDRFRFTDRGGSGSWFCNQCGHGDGGMSLAMKFLGVNFAAAATEVEKVVGKSMLIRSPRERRAAPSEVSAEMKWRWENAKPLDGNDPASWYLASRKIDVLPPPSAVRYIESIPDKNPKTKTTTYRPAMLARVVAPNLDRAVLHMTFLTPNGAKATTWQVKRFPCGALVPMGAAVRLVGLGEDCDTLGIAEGVETALSAARIFDLPVWAVLGTAGLLRFEPPAGVRKVIVFGDRDPKFDGQMMAFALAKKMVERGLKAEVEFPPTPGDWNDVLKARHGAEDAPNVVRLR